MKLHVKGTQDEQLLFQLLGIVPWTGESECGLLLGQSEPLTPGLERQLCLRLPDPDHPLQETERLARMLGRAIGLGEVRL
jgi:hypothetical protein